MKKYISLFLCIAIIALTLSSCMCFSGKTDKDDEIITSENVTEAKDDSDEEASTVAASAEENQEISFSEAKAKYLGSFESNKYGKLNVYLQEGYMLLISEFKTQLFTVFAQNITAGEADEASVIGEDMNFDGNTDFGVRYYKDNLNSYYFCFLWDKTAKTYNYFHPLTSVANPEFDSKKQTVKETKKITYYSYDEYIYSISADKLTLIHSEKGIEEETTLENLGSLTVSTEIQVMENGNSALLVLRGIKGSEHRWECVIENTAIVSLSSDNYDILSNTQEFLLTALKEGATTVIFRFRTADTNEIVEEVNVNAYVTPEMNVNIIVPMQ